MFLIEIAKGRVPIAALVNNNGGGNVDAIRLHQSPRYQPTDGGHAGSRSWSESTGGTQQDEAGQRTCTDVRVVNVPRRNAARVVSSNGTWAVHMLQCDRAAAVAAPPTVPHDAAVQALPRTEGSR